MEPLGDDRLVRFGVFEFDPSALQLRKGRLPVRLRPQALKLLRMFVSRPRQVITREAIHQESGDVRRPRRLRAGRQPHHQAAARRARRRCGAPRYIETLTRRRLPLHRPGRCRPQRREQRSRGACASCPGCWRRLTDPRVVPIAAGVLAVAAVCHAAGAHTGSRCGAPAQLHPCRHAVRDRECARRDRLSRVEPGRRCHRQACQRRRDPRAARDAAANSRWISSGRQSRRTNTAGGLRAGGDRAPHRRARSRAAPAAARGDGATRCGVAASTSPHPT